MKRLLLALLLLTTCYFAQAIQTGCDWWVRTNGAWGGSHTSMNTSCADMIFLYMDGTPVPKENVQCCDWSGDFYTGTGINCAPLMGQPRLPEGSPLPSGPPVIDGAPKQNNDGTHGNWVIDAKIRIGIDRAANVSLYHQGFSKTPVLFNLEQKYGNKPIDITTERINTEEIRIVINPLEGKKNKLDTKGAEYITYKVSDLKQQVYQANIGEIFTLFPNPVKQGKAVQLSSKFTDEKVEVAIYNKTGACVFNSPLTKQTLDIESTKLKKEVYFYTFIVNGIQIKGGSLVIE